MAEGLYSRDILRLASSLLLDDHLDTPDGVAELRAPLCGSRMIVEGQFSGDHILAMAIKANACALGQASAAMVKQRAVGADIATIATVRAKLAAGLAGDAEMPIDWPELAFFEPARTHVSRHGAILLPFDALIAASENARSKADA